MAYYYVAGLSGVGFSLKPPKIVRKIGGAVVGALKVALPVASVFIPGLGPAVIAAAASSATGSNPTSTDKQFLSRVSRGLTLPAPGAPPAAIALQAAPALPAETVAAGVSNQTTTLLIGAALLGALALSSSRGSRRRR